jgi:cyclic pyranopterin phosphate synthase
MKLTHVDERGQARMVDVGAKDDTRRVATAHGRVLMKPETLRLIADGKVKKGDALGVARLAGIMAAKKTAELIPLCHNILILSVEMDIEPDEASSCVVIRATVTSKGKTGVEMEALTAVTVASLALYDMLKAADKDMTITDVFLLEKNGGKSGHYKKGAP